MSFFTNVFKRGGTIYARGVDDAGNPTMTEHKFKPFLFTPTNQEDKAQARGLRGESLMRIDFETINDFEDYLERYRDVHGFRVFGSRDVVHQYISTYYPGEIGYDMTAIRGAIVDLEVESGVFRVKEGAQPGEDGCFNTSDISEIKPGPFPEPDVSKYPITAATVYDTKTKTFYTLGLEVFTNDLGQKLRVGTYKHDPNHDKVGKLKVFYKGFKSEVELLQYLIMLLNKMAPNYLSGWNSDTFDVPYMVTRMKNVLGDQAPKAISPWGLIRQRTFVGNFGREEIAYEIYGVDLLDFKELVEKHAYVELANKKLNTAAKHFLNEEKMSYDQAKGLSGLYFLGYQDYIVYNIRDVDLIVRMEAKLKFFELSYSLAYMFHCNPGDTMGTVQPWSAMTYNKLHNRGQEPEMRPLYDGDIQFLGGYVEEPKPGLYKWVISIDAQSLYPHNIMQFNLGVETKLDERESYEIRMELVAELDAHEQTPYIIKLKNSIREGKLLNDFYWENPIVFQTLKKRDVLMAPNCTFYRRDIKSVFAEFCDEIYSTRSKVKKVMLAREQELTDLKDTPDYDKDKAWALESEISKLNNQQQALKIAMNSLFGALGNRYFREFFDVKIAEAITSVGQNGIQYISRRLNEWFNEKAGTKGVKYSIYNDTDSVYVYIDPWINKMFTAEEQKDVDKVIGWMDKMVKTELEPLLLKWAEELADALNCPTNKLIFKREALATAGIWVAKKRYALMVSNNEGVQYPKPKLKFTGLEAKKSDYPQFCRDWLKQAYEIALTKSESDLHELVKKAKAEFMSKPVHEIAGPKSVNNIEKYIDESGNAAKGTPAQVKAANNYNLMLRSVNSVEKPIVSGDKILIAPLKPGAPRGMETIGFPEYLPEEFDLHRWIDYKASFEKFFVSPLNNYIGAVNWAPEPRASALGFFV